MYKNNSEILPGRGHTWGNPYRQNRVINQHKDNSGVSYNGCSSSQRHSYIRVPSIKRSIRVWKNFYAMFPGYKLILDECLAGTIPCVKYDDCVAVKIPDTTYCTIYKANTYPGSIKSLYIDHNLSEFWNNTVKLKIVDLT